MLHGAFNEERIDVSYHQYLVDMYYELVVWNRFDGKKPVYHIPLCMMTRTTKDLYNIEDWETFLR